MGMHCNHETSSTGYILKAVQCNHSMNGAQMIWIRVSQYVQAEGRDLLGAWFRRRMFFSSCRLSSWLLRLSSWLLRLSSRSKNTLSLSALCACSARFCSVLAIFHLTSRMSCLTASSWLSMVLSSRIGFPPKVYKLNKFRQHTAPHNANRAAVLSFHWNIRLWQAHLAPLHQVRAVISVPITAVPE